MSDDSSSSAGSLSSSAGTLGSIAPVPEPEPTSLTLAGLGRLSLLLFRCRKYFRPKINKLKTSMIKQPTNGNSWLCHLNAVVLGIFALATGAHADTTLTTWDITAAAYAEANDGAVSNYSSAFTASQIYSGTNLVPYSQDNAEAYNYKNTSLPANTWGRIYINSPFPIPTSSARALSSGFDFLFTSVVAAGYDVKVDGVSNLYIGNSKYAGQDAGLFFSTDSGTSWTQAGGTASLPSVGGLVDYSAEVNAILNSNPVDLDNTAGNSPLTVDWALAVWGGGIGGVGIGTDANGGGNILLTLNGDVTATPEPSTLALFALGAGALLPFRRRK